MSTVKKKGAAARPVEAGDSAEFELANAVRPVTEQAAEKVTDASDTVVPVGKYLAGRGMGERLGTDFVIWMKSVGGRTKWMLLERYGEEGAGSVLASGDHEHDKIQIDCCALLKDQGPEFAYRHGADIEQPQGNLSVKRHFREEEMVSRLIQRGFDRDLFAADWTNQAGGS